tara:strand:- start:2461 stop:2739 length:279 start_codon:yes stop_codon:yes gene_type:complete
MSDIAKELGDLFDEALLRVLKQGRTVVDKDGRALTVEPTAADLNVIRSRLKDCGITAMATDDSPIGSIVEEMRRRGMKMPEVDTTQDDAATA